MIHLDPINTHASKEEKYKLLLKQVEAIIDKTLPQNANLANVIALLHHTFNFHWTGFYFVFKNDDSNLILDIFQGPVACTRIKKGSGVCGTSWQKMETIIVPDVNKFPGHIACSSLTQSEIVVPIIKNSYCIGVLDIDSKELNHFTDTDKAALEKLVQILICNIFE